MEKIESLLKQGEGLAVEFKESRQALNRDVYETVCAFLNRHGGTLLLGVKDNGTVANHLPDPFYLEGDMSISLREAIFREVASNILIHREYTNAFPAKLIIERGQVRTENSSKPHGFGVLNPATFTPFPKNPVIDSFFQQIGRADELGSGMRKLMKYGKAYGGADPELIEGDVFRMIVKVPEFEETAGEQAGATGKSSEKMSEKILLAIRQDRQVTIAGLAERIGVTTRTIERKLKVLQSSGRLRRVGPDKGGHWDLLD